MTLTETPKTSIPPASLYWREVGAMEVLGVFVFVMYWTFSCTVSIG